MRLMTVHRAKGLEFPVVCVADLGKDGREDGGVAADLQRRPAWGCGWRRSAAARSTRAELERIKRGAEAGRRGGGAARSSTSP